MTAASNTTSLLTPVRLGGFVVDAPVLLAPMSGVTDPPYRRAVARFGAGLIFSEMIASRCMVDEWRGGSKKASADYTDETGPIAVQLAGCEPNIMAEAAKINADRGASVIDINFGCPVKKVVTKMAGSALMRDEPLAAAIMEATVKAVDVPVTVKMRLGWDHDSINAPRLAKIAQDLGIQMVTVHGRTRNQLYNGQADWHAVQAVRDAISLPLIVNGDITDDVTARKALAASGACGVMVGRGTYGRPWQLRDMMATLGGNPQPAALDSCAIYEHLMQHYDDILAHYGIHQGLQIARKHVAWYCADFPDYSVWKPRINTADTVNEAKKLIRDFFDTLSSHDQVFKQGTDITYAA